MTDNNGFKPGGNSCSLASRGFDALWKLRVLGYNEDVMNTAELLFKTRKDCVGLCGEMARCLAEDPYDEAGKPIGVSEQLSEISDALRLSIEFGRCGALVD